MQIPSEVAIIVGLDHINTRMIEQRNAALEQQAKQQLAEIEKLKKKVAALAESNGEVQEARGG